MSDTENKSGAMRESEATRLDTLVEYGDGAVVSRTLSKTKGGNLSLFAFDAGQGLSEHSAPFDAYVTILDGEAVITIAGNDVAAKTGETVLMPKDIPHALTGPGRFKMLLTMLK